jgi:Tol biopolymer transport system component
MLPHLEAAVTPSGGITPTDMQPVAATPKGKRWYGWAAGALTFGAIVAGVWVVLSTLGPRGDDGSGVPVVPIQLTANPLELSLTGSAISPDGDYLAFVDPRGVHIQTLATNETHAVPLEASLTPWRVWWYPDGTHLLLLGTSPGESQSLWSVSIFGGVPRQVLTDVWQAAVAPDGSTIATIRNGGAVGQTFREIWIMGPDGENARLLDTAEADESFWRIAWTPDGASLAVGTWSTNGSTRNIHISLISVADGQRRALLSNPDLWQAWTGPLPMQWCGDSRLVFSRRDGPAHQVTSNVWVVDVDLGAAELMGEPRRLTQWTGANVRELSVTHDCSRIVVLQVRNQADVFVGDLDASGNAFSDIRKLTFDQREDYPGGWAPDASGLLITSARSGDYDLYYRGLGADAHTPLQGGQGDQLHPVFAPGGERVLYVQDGDIWSVPANRGAAELIQEGEFAGIRCPITSEAPCVVGSIQDGRYLFHALDLDHRALTELAATAHREPFTHFDLSPDGIRVAVIHNDDNKILILDLETGAETAITVEGWSKFEYISWTAEGNGFFVNAGFGARAQHYAALIRVDMDGRSHVLRDVPWQWQVRPKASPDGRYLAYASMPFHGNAWLLEGF